MVLVIDSHRDLWEASWHLLRIGYDLPSGWLAGGMMAWRTAAKPIQMLPQMTVRDLQERLRNNSELLVLDVRQPGEWSAGHMDGALHISGGELPSRIGEVPRARRAGPGSGPGRHRHGHRHRCRHRERTYHAGAGRLARIARPRRLSRATMRNIRQNLFFAFVYNVLGVPIAAGILYPVFGILLSPIIAARR